MSKIYLFLASLDRQTVLELTLILGLIFAILFLLKEQKKDANIRLINLVTGDNGRISGTKFSQIGAFLLSTWAFAFLVVSHELTEWFFGLYMAVWSGSSLVNKWVAKNQATGIPPIPPFSTPE
ncbi:MAG: hypothetical protein ACREQ5_04245 [Candidatus Dormibacteria bacterium]